MTCGQCGAINRPGARFCATCGGSLAATPGAARQAVLPAPARTAKICPRCQAQSAVSANRCAKCGYSFATAAPAARYWWTRLAFVMSVLVLLAGAAWGVRVFVERTAAPATTPVVSDPTASLERAIRATVQVLTPEDGVAGLYSAGSGTVINGEKGYILTNFHVIGDAATGQLYNREGVIFIAVSPTGSNQPPEISYMAELADAEAELDLALLRIVAQSDGSNVPEPLGLTEMPIGNSSAVRIGDAITVLGYPGLGGDTLTLTRGTVSGFLDGWMKTDAETNHGNSGGAAINSAGELVGVPTAGKSEEVSDERLPGKIGLIQPINRAARLIDAANQ